MRAVEKWTAFRQLFYTVPKKLQRLLNTLHAIIKAKIYSSHCILAYDEVINSIYMDPQTQFREHTVLCISQMQFWGHIFTNI